MTARNDILRLMSQYCFTIDTGDMEAWATLFEYGEWGLDGGTIFVGKAEVLKATENVRIYPDGTPKTKHSTSNVELNIDEANGNAKSQCYVTVFQQTDELPLQPIFSGHYFDEFAVIQGAWRFKKRIIRYMLVGNMSAHLAFPAVILPDE